MMPRSEGRSALWCRILVDETIKVGAEMMHIDCGRVRKCLNDAVPRDEPTSPDRLELPDRDAVPGHHKALAIVERTHDLTASVLEFALR